MSYQAVRRRYTKTDAPGGSLMYEMHWDELPFVGYAIMKFQHFRKAVQIQRMRQNGKAMLEILITRPSTMMVGWMRAWFRLRSRCAPTLRCHPLGTSGTGCGTTQVSTWWSR